jgi:trigger factor
MDIEKSDYIENVEKGLRNIRTTASVPGFRKGMAPIGIIKKTYGKQILYDELDKLVHETLKSYFEEHPELKLVGVALMNKSSLNATEPDGQENFTVTLDLPMSPKVDVELSKDDVLPYMKVVLKDEWVDAQLEKYRISCGDYTEEVDIASGNVLIKGKLAELENGAPKEDGIVLEEAMLLPSLLKNTGEAGKFNDAAKGSVVIFNPRKAYEGATSPNQEIAKLLVRAQQEVENLDSDFSFEITGILRHEKASLDQQFFDIMLGEPGAVQSLDEFMAEFRNKLAEMFVPECDYLFKKELSSYLRSKAGEMPIAADLLKRQILLDSENITEAEIDETMPETLEDIRIKLIIDHILERYKLKVTRADVEALAYMEAQRMLQGYGISTYNHKIVQSYAEQIMDNQKSVQQLTFLAKETKLVVFAKKTATLDIKELTPEELAEVVRSKSSQPAAE